MRLSGLYAITPDQPDTAVLLGQVEQALQGGARLLQYRNKIASADLRHAQASQLLAMCRVFGAQLIINDDVALTTTLGADGVHLGREDGDFAAARRALGPTRLLGVSCYTDLARAREAIRCGADYVAFGSFYASATKPGAVRASLDLLREAHVQLHSSGASIAAIGGINLENAPQLIAAGADLLAVITDLFEAPDIRARAADYLRLFDSRIPA